MSFKAVKGQSNEIGYPCKPEGEVHSEVQYQSTFTVPTLTLQSNARDDIKKEESSCAP